MTDPKMKGVENDGMQIREIKATDKTLRCYDCGILYRSFPDLNVSDEVWLQISPTGHEGGILCPTCIGKRLKKKGLDLECPACFNGAPLKQIPLRFSIVGKSHRKAHGYKITLFVVALLNKEKKPFQFVGRTPYRDRAELLAKDFADTLGLPYEIMEDRDDSSDI